MTTSNSCRRKPETFYVPPLHQRTVEPTPKDPLLLRCCHFQAPPNNRRPPQGQARYALWKINGLVQNVDCNDCGEHASWKSEENKTHELNKHKLDVGRQGTRCKTEFINHCWPNAHTLNFNGTVSLMKDDHWKHPNLLDSSGIQGYPVATCKSSSALSGTYAGLDKANLTVPIVSAPSDFFLSLAY